MDGNPKLADLMKSEMRTPSQVSTHTGRVYSVRGHRSNRDTCCRTEVSVCSIASHDRALRMGVRGRRGEWWVVVDQRGSEDVEVEVEVELLLEVEKKGRRGVKRALMGSRMRKVSVGAWTYSHLSTHP